MQEKQVYNYETMQAYREFWGRGRRLKLFPKVEMPKWMLVKICHSR